LIVRKPQLSNIIYPQIMTKLLIITSRYLFLATLCTLVEVTHNQQSHQVHPRQTAREFGGMVTHSDSHRILITHFTCTDFATCFEQFQHFCTPSNVTNVCYNLTVFGSDCYIQGGTFWLPAGRDSNPRGTNKPTDIRSFGLDNHLHRIKSTIRYYDDNFTYAFNSQCKNYLTVPRMVWSLTLILIEYLSPNRIPST